MCTINKDHMMYGSWDIRHEKQSFSSFWIIFYPFTLLTTWKIKNEKILQKVLKKLKRQPEISSFHISVWFLRYEVWQTEFLSFWAIFCPFTPLTTQKIKLLKKFLKNPSRYHHFTQVSQKPWSYATLFLRYSM